MHMEVLNRKKRKKLGYCSPYPFQKAGAGVFRKKDGEKLNQGGNID